MIQKTCLVILGTQTAALSEVAQRLDKAGFRLPGSNDDDPGHWESEKFLQINTRFLNALNRRRDDWRPLVPEDIPADLREKVGQQIQSALAAEYADAPSIVLTLPRLHRVIELYQNALDALGYDTIFVHLIPNAMHEPDPSLHASARAHSTLLWARDMLDSEAATRGAKRIFLTCNANPARNDALVSTLSKAFPDAFGGERDVSPHDQIQSPKLADKALAALECDTGITSDIYSAVRLLELDEADPTVLAHLDRLSRYLDGTAAILGDSYFEDAEHLTDDAHKIQFMLQETVPSIEQINESLQAAVKFLRKPYINALRHPLARALSRFPAFSPERRARLERSAKKTDYRTLFSQLSDVSLESGTNVQTGSTAFINALVPNRPKVLLSAGHIAVHNAITAPDIANLPTITLSFVTFNSARWLDRFFTSLQQQNYHLNKLSLIFVDHGSQDETLAKITSFSETNKQDFASIQIFERDNNGFGAGHDFAIRQSQDDFVLVSNVDLNFHEDTLTKLVAAALVDDEDIASWEVRQCPYEHPKFYDPVTLETSWSSHACILMRRSTYLRVGGYEDRIFMYGEDVELSYRFRGAGYRLRYLPQVCVTHFVSFDEPELRPHQLGGSISANVLLRHRYGGEALGEIGEELLADAVAVASNPTQKTAFELAAQKIEQDKEHFATIRTPERDVFFPFTGFDYDITRIGHDIQMQSDEPVQDSPLITIITRTHGPNISILTEAITSVMNQSYPNIEHLIVEDKTDFARTLVEDVKHSYGSHIRYIKSDGIGGAGRSVAGNTGLGAAQGGLLMFLDNDDLLFADHVELLVRRLLNRQEAVAAYSLAWNVPSFYSADGSYREGVPQIPSFHLHPYHPKRFRKANFIPIQSILFKRALFEEYGGFDTAIDHLEDWNLWVRYSKAGDFEFVPKITSLYRTPGDRELRRRREKIMLDATPDVFEKNFGKT